MLHGRRCFEKSQIDSVRMKNKSKQSGTASVRDNELKQAFADEWPLFRRVFLFTLVTTTLSLVPTGYMMEVYDRVLNSRNEYTLLMLTVLALALYMMLEVIEYVRLELLVSAANRIEERLRLRVLDLGVRAQLMRMPFHPSQLLSDLKIIRDSMGSSAATAFFDAPLSIIFLLLVYLIHPVLGYFSLAGAVIQFAISYVSEKRTQKPFEEAGLASQKSTSFAGGVFRGAQIVHALGMEQVVHDQWLKKQDRFLALQAEASEHAGFNAASSKFIQTLQGSLILAVSCWLTLKGVFSGGGSMMIVASILGGRILQPLVMITSQWRTLASFLESYKRLGNALDAVPTEPAGMPLPAPIGQLSVEALSLVPQGGRQMVLRGVQFSLQPGQVLMVLGPSASGKSSLCKALVGVWRPAAGSVRMDGADVYSWNKDELGPYVGYVSQDVDLLEGSVAENICRFGEVDRAKLDDVIALMGLGPWIASLPGGEDFQISDQVQTLSGGERQRLAIARALYGRPRFVVMDEPNASLDDVGEAQLTQMIQTLKQSGVAVVVVSHKTRILPVVDFLLVLKEGAQQAFGPRDQVLQALRQAQQSPKAVAS
jgi:ATP-binding cassette subfamily C exporter for protease/lipase